jgi:hypothetical protein
MTQQPTFKVSVTSVDVDVTVTDAQGNFVGGLTQNDFEVFEESKPATAARHRGSRPSPKP